MRYFLLFWFYLVEWKDQFLHAQFSNVREITIFVKSDDFESGHSIVALECALSGEDERKNGT